MDVGAKIFPAKRIETSLWPSDTPFECRKGEGKCGIDAGRNAARAWKWCATGRGGADTSVDAPFPRSSVSLWGRARRRNIRAH
eukprot:COSAG02_NODE_541_length_20598_cov_278.953754_7_plen_83_part_00